MADFVIVPGRTALITKEMGGVPAEELQRATRASLGMVFAQLATVDDVVKRLIDADVFASASVTA